MLPRRGALAGIVSLAAAGHAAAVDDTQKLQDLVNGHAGKPGEFVVEAASSPLLINGPINIPQNMAVRINRDFIGGPSAGIILNDGVSIRFGAAHLVNVPLLVVSGTVQIYGLKYSGRKHLAAIQIFGPGPYTNLVIESPEITDANYGILRQGKNSTLSGAIIRGGLFERLYGDAIEWNVCVGDTGVVIEDHVINGIDDVPGNKFWGIGVGVSGDAYDQDWNSRTTAKHFSIRNIKGSRLRQLVHVEHGRYFEISGISGHDISDTYGTQSHLENAVVVCYGCRDFSVSNVSGDAPVLIDAGWLGGRYIVPSSNFELNGVVLSRGGVRAEIGGLRSSAKFSNIVLRAGSLTIAGEVSDLSLTNLDITSPSSDMEPLQQQPGFLVGPLQCFRPEATRIHRSNIKLRFLGVPSI